MEKTKRKKCLRNILTKDDFFFFFFVFFLFLSVMEEKNTQLSKALLIFSKVFNVEKIKFTFDLKQMNLFLLWKGWMREKMMVYVCLKRFRFWSYIDLS